MGQRRVEWVDFILVRASPYFISETIFICRRKYGMGGKDSDTVEVL